MLQEVYADTANKIDIPDHFEIIFFKVCLHSNDAALVCACALVLYIY